MYGEITKYYILKDSLKNIPIALLDKLNVDDSILFTSASFLSTASFYRLFNPFVKDRYELYKKFNTNPNTFMHFALECASDIKQTENLDALVFLYGLICENVCDTYLLYYIDQIKDERESIQSAYNMLDYYLANKRDKIDLKKESIYKHFNSSARYMDYMDKLINPALIKSYHLFETKSFYTRCMKRKSFTIKHLTRPKWYLRLAFRIFDLISFKRRSIRLYDLMYNDKIDTTILNLEHKSYFIDSNSYNDDFEKMYKRIVAEVEKKINAINELLLYKKDKDIKKEFNIPEAIDLLK